MLQRHMKGIGAFAGAALFIVLLLVGAGRADAQSVAIFGNNTGLQTFLNSLGYTATFVADGQVATPGFLNAFSAFVYTRADSAFGSSLSATASANVASYVGATGNIVLFNGDWFDELSVPTSTTPNSKIVFKNAASFAVTGGHGFIGEFQGADAALTVNGDGFVPLGLIAGTAGTQTNGLGSGSVALTAFGTGSPVTAGASFPYDPGQVDFAARYVGVPANLILATYVQNNDVPAIIARGSLVAVPEPGSLTLIGSALVSLGCLVRRRRRVA